MLKAGPKPVDVNDLQFKLQCQLQIFDNRKAGHFTKNCSLVAVASRFGLIFLGTPDDNFQVLSVRNLEEVFANSEHTNEYSRRYVALNTSPLFLSVNYDQTVLAVIIERNRCSYVKFYDVKSFVEENIIQLQEVQLSASEVNIVDVNWNPMLPYMFTACKSDGTLGIYEINGQQVTKNELPSIAGVTCFCWSPKGKQIAVGSRDGKITQYKPDLKAVKIINAPPFNRPHLLISLQWVSNYQFIGIFKPVDSDSQSCLIVIDAPKTGNPVYLNYEDICYNSSTRRLMQFYTILQQDWNMLLIASSNSMEVGILGNSADEWKQWSVGDASRAELPLSSDHEDTLPIGFALETSTTQGLQLGETKLPAFPMLLLLSDHGTLCCFTVLNLKEGIPNICTKSELTLNVNDLQYFVKHEGRQLISNSTERQSELPMSSTATSVNDTLVSTNYSKPISQPSMFANETRLSDNAENLISNNSKQPSVFQSTTPLNYSVLDRSGGKDTVSDAMSRPQQKLPGDPPSSQHILSQSPDRTNKLEVTQDTTEALFANMVKEESVYLESSLKAVLHQGKKLKIILGTDAEKNNFLVSLQALNDFFGEILEICSTQTTEVHLLKQNLLQSWAWYEDAKAHYIASRDNSNLLLLKARPLDSASQKRLEDLRYENYYLQSQIAQAHRKLDEEWEQFQDYCRKHHILQIPTMELIFQTMVKQNTILSKQSYILKDIGSRIRRKGRNIIDSSSLLISNDNFELETHELQGNLDSTCQFRHKRAACLNKKKSHDLRNFLLTRDFPHVTAIKVNTSASILESSPSKTHKQLDSLRLKTSPCVESRLSQNVASADSKTDLRSKEFGTSIQKLTDLTLTVGSAAKHFEPAVNKSAISGSLNSAFASTFLGPVNPLSVPTNIEAVDQGSGTTVVSLTKTTPSHFKTSFNALETFSSLSTAKTTSSMRSPALTTTSQVTISPLSTLTTNTKKSPTSLNLNVKDEPINTFSFLNVPELTKAPSNQSPRTPSTSYSTSNIPLDKTATATPNLSVFSKNVFFTTAPIVSSASSDNISRTTSIFGKTDTDYAVTKPSGLSTISSANIFGNLPTSSTHTIPQSTVNTSTVAKVQAATNYAMAPTQSNATSPINLSQLSALPGAVKPSAFVATTNYPLTSSTRASTVTTSTPSMLSGSFDNTELARTSLVSNDNTEKSIFGNTDSHLPRQDSYFRDLGANGNKLLEMRNTLSESSPKSTIVGTAASINTLPSRPSSISEQISFSKTTGSATTQNSSSEKHSVPTEVSSVFGNSSFGGNKTIFGNTPQIVNSNFDIKTEQPLLSNTKDVNPVFGQGTTFGTSSNNFGSTGNFSSPAASFTYSTGSIFGNTTTMTSNTPFANTTTLSSKKSIFGNSESGEAAVFGTGSVNFQTPVTSSFSGFDSLSITSKLKTTTPFGFGGASVTNVFNSAPPEGQPADKKNIFENSSTGIFGATSGSIFGSPSVSFSNSPQFGQNTFSNTGTVAQKPSGLFSGVSDTVSQSGFGASSANMPKPGGFGSAPVFGTSPVFGPTPAFGGSPGFSSSFGASPTFGGPSKIFGSENSGFEAAATPQSASFGNLANQPVVGFGNLAQQVPNSAPGSSQFTSNSSFSNWR